MFWSQPLSTSSPNNGLVLQVCVIVGRLANKAAGGTSPVTQRIEANEVIPGWAVPAVAADLTQAICHVSSCCFCWWFEYTYVVLEGS